MCVCARVRERERKWERMREIGKVCEGIRESMDWKRIQKPNRQRLRKWNKGRMIDTPRISNINREAEGRNIDTDVEKEYVQ